jgi:hypothetical protein
MLESPRSLSEQTGPAQVFPGDFTGDGNQDVLVLRLRPYRNPTVALRAGDAAGGLGAPTVIWTGAAPQSQFNPFAVAVAADVNNDGKTDLLVWEGRGEVTSLIQGNGGAFTTVKAMSTDFAGLSFGAGDLTADGRADVIVGSRDGFKPFLGDGAGQYAAGTTVVLASGAFTGSPKPRVADIDGDAKADVLMASVDKIYWAPGNGAGTFGAAQSTGALPSGHIVWDYGWGDFNGDAKRDLLMLDLNNNGANPTRGLVLVAGTGAGTFAAPAAPLAVAKGADALHIADLDGDAADDAIVLSNDPHWTRENGLYVSSGSASGLGAPTKLPFVATGRVDVKSGDFTSDGKRDIVCVGQMGGAVGEGDLYLYASK